MLGTRTRSPSPRLYSPSPRLYTAAKAAAFSRRTPSISSHTSTEFRESESRSPTSRPSVWGCTVGAGGEGVAEPEGFGLPEAGCSGGSLPIGPCTVVGCHMGAACGPVHAASPHERHVVRLSEVVCGGWRPTWQRRLPVEQSAAVASNEPSPQVVAARALVQAVEGSCGWLRLNGHCLRIHDEDAQTHARRLDAWGTLRFHVRGLPTMRRAKWVQPLLRSVAVQLRGLGHDVYIRHGELFAPTGDGTVLRIDLAASRF